MKLNKVPLLLLLPLLISACDSQQPSYSASNANSVQPPQPQQQAPAPAATTAPPASAEPAPATIVATPPESAPKPHTALAPRELAASAAGTAPTEALAAVAPIGIGGCDSYIERYRTCVNRGLANGSIPAGRRFGLMRTFNQQVRQWQADAKSGNTGGLVSACADAEQQARPDLAKLGCTSF